MSSDEDDNDNDGTFEGQLEQMRNDKSFFKESDDNDSDVFDLSDESDDPDDDIVATKEEPPRKVIHPPNNHVRPLRIGDITKRGYRPRRNKNHTERQQAAASQLPPSAPSKNVSETASPPHINTFNDVFQPTPDKGTTIQWDTDDDIDNAPEPLTEDELEIASAITAEKAKIPSPSLKYDHERAESPNYNMRGPEFPEPPNPYDPEQVQKWRGEMMPNVRDEVALRWMEAADAEKHMAARRDHFRGQFYDYDGDYHHKSVNASFCDLALSA